MILAKSGVPSDIWPGLGVTGGLLILALMVATVFLWRNMNRQIKKVRVPTQAELLAQDRAAREARRNTSVNGAATQSANGWAPADPRRSGPPSTDRPGTTQH